MTDADDAPRGWDPRPGPDAPPELARWLAACRAISTAWDDDWSAPALGRLVAEYAAAQADFVAVLDAQPDQTLRHNGYRYAAADRGVEIRQP